MRKGPCLGGNLNHRRKRGGKCIHLDGEGGVPMLPLNCEAWAAVDNDFPLTKMGKL